MRGDPKKPRIIFWRAGPSRLLLLGQCSGNPSVAVYLPAGVVVRGCFWLQWNFFWRLFKSFCPFPDGWFTNTPANTTWEFSRFFTKNGKTPMPHPLYSPNLIPREFFLFPPDEKNSQREMFCQCGIGETKTWQEQ